MILKLFIPEMGKTIKIKDIGGIAGDRARLVFSVNWEDEMTLYNATQYGAQKFVLIDRKMREYVHGDDVISRQKYFEDGTDEPRAFYELVNLEYKNFGLVSINFLKKQLKNISNKYNPKPKYEPPPTKRPRWWPNYKPEFMRIFEKANAYKRYLKFFQDYCRYYQKHLKIFEEVLKDFEDNIIKIISVAPT